MQNVKINPETLLETEVNMLGPFCCWGCIATFKPGNNLSIPSRKRGEGKRHLTFQNSEGHQVAMYCVD